MNVRFSKNKIGLYITPDNLAESIRENINLGVYALVLSSNTNYPVHKQLDDTTFTNLNVLLDRFPIQVFCQTPRQYNLCGSSKFLAWNGNLTQDKQTTETLTSIEQEIRIFTKLAAVVILSPGYFRHEMMGKATCIKSLNKIKYLPDPTVQIVLCNMYPTMKHAIGKSLNDLHSIYMGCTDTTRAHIGIGLHLVHYHINQLYDIRTVVGVNALFAEYETLFDIPPSFIIFEDYKADSQSLCCIGSGDIAYEPSVIKAIIGYCYDKAVPLIVHCPMDIDFLLRI